MLSCHTVSLQAGVLSILASPGIPTQQIQSQASTTIPKAEVDLKCCFYTVSCFFPPRFPDQAEVFRFPQFAFLWHNLTK